MTGSFDQGLIPFYTTQFSTNVELLLQQRGSKLRGRVREGAHVGKMASPVNQIGTLSMKAPAGRFAPLGNQQASLSRRWVFPIENELPQLVDSFDEMQTVVDPKSGLVETAVSAAGRAWDVNILLTATGTATLGQDASALTTETFTSTYQVGITFGSNGNNSGLTVPKIIECKRLFEHYHNDLEVDRPTLVIGSQQHSDLLNQVQVVSTEFNSRPIFSESGMVKQFLGFDVVVSERVPQTTAGSVRGVLAFVKSGLYLGLWKDLENRIDQRVDLSGTPWQVLSKTMFGSTRTQLGKVFQILCADTTGADINP
jgi:hypothetical protein